MSDTPNDNPGPVTNFIPRKFRRFIYSALTTLYGLELIFDVLPASAENKAVAAVTFLGFGMAVVHAGPGEKV